MLTVRIPQAPETQARLEASGLELIDYDRRENGYRVRLGREDLNTHGTVLRELIVPAYKNWVR